MKNKGALVPRDRSGSSGPFMLAGTDFEIGSDSVSSEWTSDSSEDDEAPPPPSSGFSKPKRRARKRTWRIKRKLEQPNDDSSSSDSSSSSSTSSGSSSGSDGEVAKQKRQRVQVLKEWQEKQASMAAEPPRPPASRAQYDRDPVPPPAFRQELARREQVPAQLVWFNAPKKYRNFALAPGFLSQEDIAAIHAAGQHRSVSEINDRKGYLAFKHRVWRFEAQLRILFPSLYFRLMDLMRQADEEKWRRLWRNSKKKRVYPEVEYITYDVAEMGEPCFIEPHVDNKSAVTLVAMLSAPEAYEGGRSCFRRTTGRNGHRQTELQAGDAVIFRGEKLTHWITPVTAGRRVILQIELSRV